MYKIENLTLSCTSITHSYELKKNYVETTKQTHFPQRCEITISNTHSQIELKNNGGNRFTLSMNP